jgi:DNA-binding NtrC family response regulator
VRHRSAEFAGVTDTPPVPVVLIVDRDLGFVWWLGEILNNAGCRAIPALNCREALALTEDMNLELDLVFVNPKLWGVSTMIRTLTRTNKRAKIIAMRKRPHPK